MIKKLIFDVDGTLIRGVDFLNSIEATLRDLNLYSEVNVQKFLLAMKTYEKFYNNYNVKDYTKHFSKTIGVELKNNFVPIFFEKIKSSIPQKNEKLIGALKKLSLKYELVLLTNYFVESQMNRLNAIGIGKYFSGCFGEKCVKPNKKAYLDACGNAMPSECVMIGDDLFLDIEMAKKEGFKTIFVNTNNIFINSKIGQAVNCVEEIDSNIIEKL